MLDNRHLRQCAWLVGEEINRRRIAAIPIPKALTDLRRILDDEVSTVDLRHAWQRDLSARGHGTNEIAATSPELESSTDLAKRLGVTPRTVRRHAKANGTPMVAGRYVFDRDEAS